MGTQMARQGTARFGAICDIPENFACMDVQRHLLKFRLPTPQAHTLEMECLAAMLMGLGKYA
jgi:hypothetical protein